MFDRKLYKKAGWKHSEGLAKKMLCVSLVSVIAFIVIYVPLFIFQMNFYSSRSSKEIENGFAYALGSLTGRMLFAIVPGLLLNILVQFLDFALTFYVYNYRKSSDTSFKSFKSCFSKNSLKVATWKQLWTYIWLAPFFLAPCFFSISSSSETVIFFVILYIAPIFGFFAYAKVLGYSMMAYIVAENPKISAKKAMILSKKMCRGCRENIFVMYLSLTLWGLFCLVTLGFGYILFMPYLKNTFINMYEAIKKNAIESKVLSEEDFYVLQ